MKKVSSREVAKGPFSSKVSPEEIALHNQREDAWICIRDNVYDITEYIGFHPGGPETIMTGVGLPDATHLFDEVHPWVNYDKMLTNYYVGRQGVDSVSTIPEIGNVRFESLQSTEKFEVAEAPKAPEMRHRTIFKDHQRQVAYSWVQRNDLVLITFSTEAYSNPYFEIRHPPFETRWFFVITFVESVFTFQYTPHEKLLSPPRFKIFHESGVIEVGFEKKTKTMWPDLGDMRQYKRKIIPQHEKKKYIIKDHVTLNKHNFMIALEKADMSLCNTPLGYHLYLYNDINQAREFTPVPNLFIHQNESTHTEVYTSPLVTFVIRRYADGRVSNYLYNKKIGDVVMGSEPNGILDLQLIAGFNHFYMLAGGIGLTPYLAIIVFLLERKDPPVSTVVLTHFSPTAQHQILNERLTVMAEEDQRFVFLPVLTQPPPDYAGLTGHISMRLLKNTMQDHFEGVHVKEIFFFSCGPAVFNNGCYEQLSQLNVDINSSYYFSSTGLPPGKLTKSESATLIKETASTTEEVENASGSIASYEVEEDKRSVAWRRNTRHVKRGRGYVCPCPPCLLYLKRALLGAFGGKKRAQ